MKEKNTHPLGLRRTLLFTAIGIVLAAALAVSSLARASFTLAGRLSHCRQERKALS